jgi:DNA-directed RNA polymerase subunit K/omega
MAHTTEMQEQAGERERGPDSVEPITSRFLFVDVAAQRAKQLRRGALPRLQRHGSGPSKLERVAMEEVRSGLIEYALPLGYEGSPRADRT